jgi:hypothetical protein
MCAAPAAMLVPQGREDLDLLAQQEHTRFELKSVTFKVTGKSCRPAPIAKRWRDEFKVRYR